MLIWFNYHLHIFLIYISISLSSEDISSGWQSFIHFSSSGFEFSPIDMEALFLQQTTADSLEICSQMCHTTVLCRTFDFDIVSHRCRIFQGDLDTTGSIISSSLSQSVVGSIELDSTQFDSYGKSCLFCQGSRYLKCINSSCQCQSNTYFDGSICRSQKLLGSQCINETDCRTDLNYTCLPRLQCGPLSLQNGNTVAGYGNGTAGSDNNALNKPWGLAMGIDNSLYVCEYGNSRVMRFHEGSTLGIRVAGSASAGTGSNQLYEPSVLYVDASSNIYVADDINYRVMYWANGSLSATKVVGTGYSGSSLNAVADVFGITVDSHGNIYVADTMNHRVTKWIPGATVGIIIAGQNGISGSQSNQLSYPAGLFLDELHSYLYIADAGNNRIQRITLGGSTNATTVAGGNGQGSSNMQLNNPISVYVSKTTGAIYIADEDNYRVTKWAVGATKGVTVVGIDGQAGSSPMLFGDPTYVILNLNETLLYVSDYVNHRVQSFKLI
ncbi:unnamed protein product [Adineta steineri]|uniref:Apple domain-containing protein n=1 Tax=Adineta steineri TaxID=433720 RepID=A0A813ZK23_9BILA|nr:unnamed protein product [Adineta steineri]CAF1209934.1 unnamed protein product [Adineta steineri]